MKITIDIVHLDFGGQNYEHSHTTFYNIFRKKEGRGGLSFRIGISF
jgi:hypothetical protein